MTKDSIRACGAAFLFGIGLTLGAVACGDDTSVSTDAGVDSSLPGTDGGTDGSLNSDADAAIVTPDSGTDGGDVSADGGDAGNLVLTFPDQMTRAFCQHLSTCCGQTPGAPSFDIEKCVDSFETNGSIFFQQAGLVLNSHAAESGNLHYDSAKAAKCLADISAFQCAAIDSAAWNTARSDCWGAMNGTVAVGGACGSSFECAPGNFCKTTSLDGGADGGVLASCSPILASAGSCATDGKTQYNNDRFSCSYQGNGLERSLHCDLSTRQCQPQLAIGAACKYDGDCTSGICQSFCAASAAGITLAGCQSFVRDAGTD